MSEFFKPQKKHKNKKWIIISVISLTIVFVIFLLFVVFYSNLFTVKKINVQFNGLDLNKSIVLTQIEKNIIIKQKFKAFLGPNNILFWLSLPSINVLDINSYIKSITISANLFSKNVDIVLNSRKPLGVYCFMNNSCYVFDDEGVLYTLAPTVYGSLIIKINDSNSRYVILGSDVLQNKQWFNNMITIINILRNNNFNVDNIVIKNLDLREWSATLNKHINVDFGFESNVENFDQILTGLKSRIDFSKINYIDFRIENKVFYK
ncbi:MAG: hypothetical protein ACP5IC_00685 [Minisyncoccia bacterium]